MAQGRKERMVISNIVDNVEKARETAITLIGKQENINIVEAFEYDKIEDVEQSIVKLNEYADKCWLLSAILLYTLIYNKNLYEQTGLTWAQYTAESKKRLNMDVLQISEQLSSARFFIKYHKSLLRAGWTPNGSSRKLARAEYALELCGDEKEVIQHLVNDSWRNFKDWYTSFKYVTATPQTTGNKRSDISITKKNGITINGVRAYTISDEIPEQDKIRFERYFKQIFEAVKNGYEPAIVPVYDEKEANNLFRLRDKYRAGK